MGSPRDRLVYALEAWLADDARERIARARGAADADPASVVAARHAALRGPRARELFEEARERGLLFGDDLSAAAAWLRNAHAAVGRARADDRVREVLERRVPHDSDHHPPLVLFERMLTEAHEGRRRAIARSLNDALAPSLSAALREGLADVEESLEGAAWLREIAPPPDSAPATAEDARALVAASADAWSELRERVAHTSQAAIEAWPDLLFALRAPAFDAPFDPRRRWRRGAESLAALGVATALSKRAHVEPSVAGPRARSSVVAREVPRDVRIVPAGIELGLASERDARVAIGRAVAITWTHPALPVSITRAEHGSVGHVLGGLFAHLLAEPRAQGRDVSAADARAIRERAVFLELFELRTDAAIVIAREDLGSSAFAEAAEHSLRDAWAVEVPASIASCACLLDRSASPRTRAARWIAPLFGALRERYDEDWWRNPRAAELLRAACERGPALTVEAWAEELGLDAATLPRRFAELIR